jgi:CubicO group peptidase (beta-lactamase class C family)
MDYIQHVEHDLHPFGDTTHVLGSRHLTERMHYYGVSGVSVAVIDDGMLAWARSYGTRALNDASPITVDTRFPAASISKPIVAMAVLRLVQDGMLDLDKDVNHYLTSWNVPENVHTRQHKVTLRALLSHSAGITLYGFWGYRPGVPVPTLRQIFDGLPPSNAVPVRVDMLPGSRWRYSSGGYTIIQQVLIDVLNQSFADTLHDLVLAPLGMEASAFYPSPPADLAARSACGHDATGAPIPGKWRIQPELASAGMWSTPTDIAKFVMDVQHSQQGQSNKVLSPSMIAQMLTVQISNWALGPAIDGVGHVARFAHGGSAVGFQCYMVAYRERGQGAVIMTNGDRGDHLCVEVLHSIARTYCWPEYYHYLDNA